MQNNIMADNIDKYIMNSPTLTGVVKVHFGPCSSYYNRQIGIGLLKRF